MWLLAAAMGCGDGLRQWLALQWMVLGCKARVTTAGMRWADLYRWWACSQLAGVAMDVSRVLSEGHFCWYAVAVSVLLLRLKSVITFSSSGSSSNDSHSPVRCSSIGNQQPVNSSPIPNFNARNGCTNQNQIGGIGHFQFNQQRNDLLLLIQSNRLEMNRGWMYIDNRTQPEFLDGVEKFCRTAH